MSGGCFRNLRSIKLQFEVIHLSDIACLALLGLMPSLRWQYSKHHLMMCLALVIPILLRSCCLPVRSTLMSLKEEKVVTLQKLEFFKVLSVLTVSFSVPTSQSAQLIEILVVKELRQGHDSPLALHRSLIKHRSS